VSPFKWIFDEMGKTFKTGDEIVFSAGPEHASLVPRLQMEGMMHGIAVRGLINEHAFPEDIAVGGARTLRDFIGEYTHGDHDARHDIMKFIPPSVPGYTSIDEEAVFRLMTAVL
jgi:hypothetical protein